MPIIDNYQNQPAGPFFIGWYIIVSIIMCCSIVSIESLSLEYESIRDQIPLQIACMFFSKIYERAKGN